MRRDRIRKRSSASDPYLPRLSKTLIDPTRRRQAGSHYFDLFNVAPVGYVLLDRDGVVREINLTAARLIGARGAMLIGRPFVLFVAPASRGAFLEHMRRVRNRLVSADDEIVLEARDGRRVPVHLSTRLSPHHDQPEAAWTVIVDLSEQQELQEAHRVAEHERMEARHEAALAKARSDSKDRFLAALSHELRTPLTPALNATTLLRTVPDLPSEAGRLVSMIRRNIEVEVRLIDDLLDVTRIGRNKLMLERVNVDLHPLLHDAIGNAAPEATVRDVAIIEEYEAIRPVVHADPIRLRQVVWNLLSNAMKFTPAGGTITVRTINDDTGALRLSVADTGAGFDAEAGPRLFVPFEQAGQRKGNRGLGLGLAISRGIVEAHGGRIWARSSGPGRGSTFEVELTTVSANVQPATRLPTETSEKKPSGPHGQHMQVLVVEDDPDSAQTLAAILSLYGHSVSTASNLAEGLTMAERAWDVIITDLGLPDGSGLSLGRHVRNRPHPPKSLIALSGFGAPSDVEASRQAGFDVHLTKPADIDRLLEILSSVPH